jgi:hypothetical protein
VTRGARHLVVLTTLASLILSVFLLGASVPRAAASLNREELFSFDGTGTTSGPFAALRRIAVHEATGDVYAIDDRHDGSVIDKFDPTGAATKFSALERSSLSGGDVSPPFGPVTFNLPLEADIAVDNSATPSNGNVYVEQQFPEGFPYPPGRNTVFAFDEDGNYLFRIDRGEGAETCGVGVDSEGHIWVADQSIQSAVEYTSAGVPTGNVVDASAHGGICHIAFDSQDNMYGSLFGGGGVFGGIDYIENYGGPVVKYSSAGVFQGVIDSGEASDVAIDPVNDHLFAVHAEEVKEYDSSGAPVGEIQFGGNLSGVAIDGSSGTPYVSTSSDNKVHAFGPVVVLPDVNTAKPSSIEETTATLSGSVNPDGVPLEDCYFEYGPISGLEHDVPCTPSAASIPTSGTTQVSAEISRPPGGALIYRLVARNANGTIAGNTQTVGVGVVSFDGTTLREDGDPETQAGGHPFVSTTTFKVSTVINSAGGYKYATEQLKDVAVNLPPGLVYNPQSAPLCSLAAFTTFACPIETQIGVITIWRVGWFKGLYGPDPLIAPLYNLEAPPGTAALFGFNFAGAVSSFSYGAVRSGTDYGQTVGAKNLAQFFPIEGVSFELWGVPASHRFDKLRGPNCISEVTGAPTGSSCPSKDANNLKTVFTAPTSCTGPTETTVDIHTWEGGETHGSFLSHDNTLPEPSAIGTEGCNTLDFSPTLEARPTTNVADSPSGLSVDIHLPQASITDPKTTAEAHLRDAKVTLPEGFTINPSSANGLGGCSPSQIGLATPIGSRPIHFTPVPDECPDPSRIGTAEIDTPLLDHPMPGSVFVAAPHDNPFGSLLALYISVDDKQSGTVVKLAGEVKLDPQTGQITTTFEENPQLPFEDLRLKISGGAAGPLRTPEVCGVYSTTSSLTPWSAPDSGPPATPADTYAIEQGAIGGSCAHSTAERPNAPTLDAGSVEPLAGKASPLVVNLRRDDGSQQFSTITLAPPAGLIGELAGIPACSPAALEAAAAKTGAEELASPSCPAASEVGSANTSAGAGPAPYNVHGKVYLAGPYKGAPLSFAFVVPAVAGPFDLGTVVVRAAIFIDRKTGRITAVADQLPSILHGIPLDVRTVQVLLDRSGFIRNPTTCDPLAFDGQLISTLGQAAALSSRFQVGECDRLPFEPKLSLRLRGSTTRTGNPALTVTLKPRAGDANIEGFSFALPPTEQIDNEHFGTICTRVQFVADQCPVRSVYGSATAITPVLDQPLTGPVYLRSNPDGGLPNAVADLRGPASLPIQLEGEAKVDTFHGGLRSTVEVVPDAPISEVVIHLRGGSKGLFQNSTDLCRRGFRATTKFNSYNGLELTTHPKLQVKCGGTGKAKRGERR